MKYSYDKKSAGNHLFSQTAGIQLTLLSKSGWFLQNDVNNQLYNYKDTSSTDQNFWLWNMGMGKKFLKKKQAELKLSVFDLLKQNQSITRTIENTITNSKSVCLINISCLHLLTVLEISEHLQRKNRRRI